MNGNLNIEEEDVKFRKERAEQDAEEEMLYLKRWVYCGNSIPFCRICISNGEWKNEYECECDEVFRSDDEGVESVD
jgi:hypothetical protein|tara:strand:- start:1617 stop:1844 length:228 start_codon:yes stop_codon:yes gene_type:complete